MNRSRYRVAMELCRDPCVDPARYAQALADEGNYPTGMHECDAIGLGGGCGEQCPIFKSGKCEYDDTLPQSRGTTTGQLVAMHLTAEEEAERGGKRYGEQNDH